MVTDVKLLSARTIFVLLSACLLCACAAPASSDSPEDALFSKFPIAKLGKKVVLTKGAAKRAADIGMEPLLSQSVTTVVRDWVLVRLPEESVATIERYADVNSKVWQGVKKSPSSAATYYRLRDTNAEATTDMFYKFCGTKLELNVDTPLAITLTVREKLPIVDFCNDLMLVFAANGIVVHESDGKLVGDFVNLRPI